MNLSFDFSGRVALVTGAAEGIGFDLCWMFAEAGAKVVPVDHDAKSLKTTWGNGSEFVLPIATGVVDSTSAEGIVAACREWGGLDIVVDNSELAREAVNMRMDDGDWDNAVAAHTNSNFELTRAAIPLMRTQQHGRIVNVTSNAGMYGSVGRAKFAAAKARIGDFTQSVATEVVGFGITMNAVSPIAFTDAGGKPDNSGRTPEAYFANPREISAAVDYLCSGEARHISGIDLPIDDRLSS